MITKFNASIHLKNIFSENKNEPSCEIKSEILINMQHEKQHAMFLATSPDKHYSLHLNGILQNPCNTDKLRTKEESIIAFLEYKFIIPSGTTNLRFTTHMPVNIRKNSDDPQRRIYSLFYDFVFLKSLRFHQQNELLISIIADYDGSIKDNILKGKPIIIAGGKSREEEKGITYALKIRRRNNSIQTCIKPQYSLPDTISISIGRKPSFK